MSTNLNAWLALAATVCGGLLLMDARPAHADASGPFLEVRELAERRVETARALTEPEVDGFGRRAQQRVADVKHRLAEALAGDETGDDQLHRLGYELKVAMDRFERARELRTAVERAAAEGERADDASATGFGHRYRAALGAAAEAPRPLLDDPDATLDELEAVTTDLDEALSRWAAAERLREIAENAIDAVALVAHHAADGFDGLDDDTVAALDRLRQAVASQLANPDATIATLEQHTDDLVDALDRLGERLEARFTHEVNQPSPPFPDGLGAAAFEQVDSFRLPDEGWRFRRDRSRLGYDEGWYAPEFDDTDWRTIEIGNWWGPLLDERYVGAGWYRATIDVPDLAEHDALGLHFSGVDESAWAWIDGQYVGQRDDDPANWNRPFQLDVTGLVEPGRTHHFTVRVRNTDGQGGLWEPVRLRAYRKVGD